MLDDEGCDLYAEEGIGPCRNVALRALQDFSGSQRASLAGLVARSRGEGPQLFVTSKVAYLPTPWYGCLENGRVKPEWVWSLVTHEYHSLFKLACFNDMTRGRAPPPLWRCPGVPR
jgi:hypothetical protein